MKTERDFNFDIKTSDDLNKVLTGLLMDVRRGEIDLDKAKSITLIADKINKNNVNQIEYKKITKHNTDLNFFNNE